MVIKHTFLQQNPHVTWPVSFPKLKNQYVMFLEGSALLGVLQWAGRGYFYLS